MSAEKLQDCFFEVNKRFAQYGHGTMLCYSNGFTLEYVMFKAAQGYRKVIINADLMTKYKNRGAF